MFSATCAPLCLMVRFGKKRGHHGGKYNLLVDDLPRLEANANDGVCSPFVRLGAVFSSFFPFNFDVHQLPELINRCEFDKESYL